MVFKICERLQIPHPVKIIKIEDIASREEIEKAVRSRKIEGKHVIPVPALEIRRNYPSIFYDSIRVFLKRNFGAARRRGRASTRNRSCGPSTPSGGGCPSPRRRSRRW